MHDAARKGHQAGKGRSISRCRGMLNGQARLSDAQVRRIVNCVAAGEMQKNVAARFGVAKSYVSQLCAGKRRAASALEI
jgi:hypothetical protein